MPNQTDVAQDPFESNQSCSIIEMSSSVLMSLSTGADGNVFLCHSRAALEWQFKVLKSYECYYLNAGYNVTFKLRVWLKYA